MLHLPMQSVANETPEAQELHPGMPAPEVAALVDQFLQNVPDAAGVNNHQGSQATADVALMDELMPVLRDRHLFYVDSRTPPLRWLTIRRETLEFALPFATFLSSMTSPKWPLSANSSNWRCAAPRKGEAVAIGHPHAATLQALREVLPQAKAQGVRLVLASELVH